MNNKQKEMHEITDEELTKYLLKLPRLGPVTVSLIMYFFKEHGIVVSKPKSN